MLSLMASLTKHDRSPFWHAMYRDATGRQHNKSTKIQHTPEAETPKERAAAASKNRRLALELALNLEEAERGNAVEAHLRKLLADISSRVNKRALQFVITRTYLNEWADRAKTTKAPATALGFATVAKTFLESLGPKAEAPLADITTHDVDRYVQSRLSGNRKPSSVAVNLATLNIPFAQAFKQGLILTNPVAGAEKPDKTSESRDPFTWDQVNQLLQHAKGEWKTTIMLAVFTGQRLGDVTSLTWDSVDTEAQVIKLRPQKTARLKKDLIIPIHPDLLAHLMDLPFHKDQPICPELSKHYEGGSGILARQFAAIMEAAGIGRNTMDNTTGKIFHKLSFHSLRHTYVSLLANAGIAPDVRQQLSGHSDSKSHAIYTHTQLATLTKAVNSLPRLQ